MKNSFFERSLVEASWLKDNLDRANLVILDATLPIAVASDKGTNEPEMRIPSARFFDIKNTFSDTTAPFPNTWPGGEAFNKAAKELGVFHNSAIVVYDDHGIYSSARAWWMFRSMGHHNVAVLNGGRKAWIEAGFPLEPKKNETYPKGDFEGTFDSNFFRNNGDVLENLRDNSELVIDARAEDRFKGLVEEPRKGLRSGHIPGSVNLPYSDLLSDGKMLDSEKLRSLFEPKVQANKKLVFSCGSGITACVLALGAEISGYNNLAVYDGSWTEWGSLTELPIEK